MLKGPCSISLGENKEKSKEDFNISNIYLAIFLVHLLDLIQIPRSLLFSFVVSKTWKICYTHVRHILTSFEKGTEYEDNLNGWKMYLNAGFLA